MLIGKPYDRNRVYEYARRWAFERNPLFTDYTGRGGNCTNFASQCCLAGGCVMNYTPIFGWYFISDADRAPAWTGVSYFYNFMTSNNGVGPFGEEVDAESLRVGDFIQLGRDGEGYYHTLVVVGEDARGYLVAAQSDDAFARPLSEYSYDFARYIHILGVREEVSDDIDCFMGLYNATALPIPPEGMPGEPPAAPPTPPASEQS